MHRTKIDWCDYSWNPVWGCRNACSYCYARKTARRFGESFEPHWKQKNFDRPMPKRPARIFVNSMSDVAHWEPAWLDLVLVRIRENPGQRFLFLTKSPAFYARRGLRCGSWPTNCWLGATATTARELLIAQDWLESLENLVFLSLEPILERIPPEALHPGAADWLILGAETGSRAGRVVPEREWIAALAAAAPPAPLFMEESLRAIWGGPLVQQVPEEKR